MGLVSHSTFMYSLYIMYIEDLIKLLAKTTRIKVSGTHLKIINSLYTQTSNYLGLSQRQETLAISILHCYVDQLNLFLTTDIRPYLVNPSFRLIRKKMNYLKKISVLPNDIYGKIIRVEFPFNEKLMDKIKKARDKMHFVAWDAEEKSWFFSCDERSITFLSEFVELFDFIADDEFKGYLAQVNEIKNNLENFLPMLTVTDSKFNFVNVPSNVIQPDTSDITKALFLARQIGIQTWDDKIDALITNANINTNVKRFLDSPSDTPFEFFLENNNILDLSDILANLMPCIFIIPGGIELEKLKDSLAILDNIGIDHSCISVLFRLPKETNCEFNKFVKDARLNNPITDKTKIVFISSRFPKPLLESNIKFKSVVNFNFVNVHYNIREFVNQQHDVIHILDKKSQKVLNFDLL